LLKPTAARGLGDAGPYQGGAAETIARAAQIDEPTDLTVDAEREEHRIDRRQDRELGPPSRWWRRWRWWWRRSGPLRERGEEAIDRQGEQLGRAVAIARAE